jgi:hypothetical protein
MKPLRIILAFLVLRLWSGQANAETVEACKRLNSTLLVIRLETGFRVVLTLARDGNKITGRAQAWQANGITAGQGNVTGRFVGTAPAGQGYVLDVYWEGRKDLNSSWFKGTLHHGEGNGTAQDLAKGIGRVQTTATTNRDCERWPEQFSVSQVVRASPPQVEPNVNRPGADYRNFDLATASYEACRSACEADRRCSVYTYVKPGAQGPKAHCWLKDNVPASRAGDCCVSGVIRTAVSTPHDPVKMAPGLGNLVQGGGTASTPVAASPTLSVSTATSRQVEMNIDRPGGDYRNFDLSTASHESCRVACRGDARCKAYTYVKPGVQGPKARCWLKDTIPASRANDCCVSGVRTAFGTAPSPGGGTVSNTSASRPIKQLGKRPADPDPNIDYGGAPRPKPGTLIR